jgi:hypothetical protein
MERTVTRLAAAAFVLITAAPAWAQIYSWKDASGNLVVSDRPRPDQGEMTTYAVGGGFRATRENPSPDSSRFDAVIDEHARRNGLAPDLVRAVIRVESAFNPNAVSSKGAMGLMQLMPATAAELGVSNPFHPEQNIRGGTVYLKRLLDRYDQDVTLALAAYNAGPGAVERYGAVPPYRETKRYVEKVTGAAAPTAPPRAVIYKWVEIVDGRPVARYSNTPPVGIAYEIVGR